MSSWDRMQIQEPHAARALWAGLAATIVITGLMYVAPLTGASVWNIPGMIAKVLSFDEPAIAGSGLWVWGIVVYVSLGIFVLPAAYAYWAYSYLPGRPVVRGLIYGALLWLLTQLVVLPLIGGGAFDRKSPNLAAEILTQLVLWLIYGFILGALAGTQQIWRQRPHQEKPA